MNLFITILIIIVVACAFYYADRYTKFKKLAPAIRQTIIGVSFGLLCCLTTEFGFAEVSGGGLINCREGIIVSCGLLFGPWAAILSALIGAFDRFFLLNIFYDVGSFTQIASTLSILISGLISAIFSLWLQRKKKMYLLYAVSIITVAVVMHLFLIIITNLSDLQDACFLILRVFVSLYFANFAVGFFVMYFKALIDIKQQKLKFSYVLKNFSKFYLGSLNQSFQGWLLVIILLSFCCTVMISSSNLENVASETVANRFTTQLEFVDELIDADIKLYNSSYENIAVYYTKKFGDEKAFHYAVASNDNHLESGAVDFDNLESALSQNDAYSLFKITGEGEYFYAMYSILGSQKFIVYTFIKHEMFSSFYTIILNTFVYLAIFAIILTSVFVLLKLLVTRNIEQVNKSLKLISSGNLEEKVDIYSHEEFAQLSDSINATVDTLKSYIDNESKRIDEELEISRQIQISSLPSVFPPFPNIHEIDLYAKYRPAKIVGGDFYDYYIIGNNKLVFLIADVSGKSIPAAMFMMRAKTSFRVFAEKKNSAGAVMAAVNNYLCDNNEAQMFVTAWLGIFDIKKGRLNYACAGHETPILVDPDNDDAKYLEGESSLVLGAMPDTNYANNSCYLKEGQKILLHTDGVSDAQSPDGEFYSTDKILDVLKNNNKLSIRDLCETVADNVIKFANHTEQYDDCTLLCFVYNGKVKNDSSKKDYWESDITVFSKPESADEIIENCEQTICESDAPDNFADLFDVCIDEIYSNIVKYSYKRPDEYVSFKIIVDCRWDRKFAEIYFVDTGPEFNPLEMEAPDLDLSAEERPIGGLGIYIVREMMDEMTYEYKGGANWLFMRKYFD